MTLAGTPGVALAQSAAPQGAPAGRVETRRVETAQGARDYRLFVPASVDSAQAAPLVVMLHGCTQDAADIARGTRLDALAAKAGVIAVYPEQPATANPKKCWNWYDPAHQRRDGGEPASIVAVVRDVMATQKIDAARVYVAGISAGGAMAAIVGAAYPELFAAVGVHSGLAVGQAANVMEALAAMAKGPQAPAPPLAGPLPPLFVIHGTADAVLNVANAPALAAQWVAGRRVASNSRVVHGETGGYAYTREEWGDARTPDVVLVTVQGLGHAWSGGAPEGTFTDVKGPPATLFLLDFLLERRGAAR